MLAVCSQQLGVKRGRVDAADDSHNTRQSSSRGSESRYEDAQHEQEDGMLQNEAANEVPNVGLKAPKRRRTSQGMAERPEELKDKLVAPLSTKSSSNSIYRVPAAFLG